LSSRPPGWLTGDALLAQAVGRPDAVAVAAEGSPHTYGELELAARRLAQHLQGLGLERGGRVAVQMENSWPCVVSIYAVWLVGGVIVVVNPQTKEDKLAYMLADSEASVLLTDREPPASGALTVVRADEIDAVTAAGEVELAPAGTIPVDLAAIVYTSGSTGVPKGVMMTHGNLVFVTESVVRYLRLGPDERIFNVFPLAFTYGLNQLLLAVRLGATLLLERSFAFPTPVLERLRAQGATVFPGVPTIFATLLGLGEAALLPSVTRVTNAGAALPTQFVAGVRRTFPNALVYLMYGQTECVRVSYLDPDLLEVKPGSVGRAIPGTEAVVLREDGLPAAPGETGVLHVRGPHVMAGYWRQPELTTRSLSEGGHPGDRVLRTGDHFRTDEDGLLYFVARSDDIIKTRGEKVSPLEVENVLYELTGVREAAVVAVADEVLGQAVRAYVALAADAEVSELEVKRHCRARLENFMVPREVIFLPDLPKTETGKIRKQSLREAE